MRPAPAVTIPLRRFAVWHAWVAVAGTAGFLSLWFALALVARQDASGLAPLGLFQGAWVLDLQLLACFATGLVAWVAALAGLWQRDATTLAWDGQHWTLDAKPLCALPRVAQDAGGVLLLMLRTSEGIRWVPVTRQAGADLHALRCALLAGSPQGPVQPLSL